jgi:hypothetical protein
VPTMKPGARKWILAILVGSIVASGCGDDSTGPEASPSGLTGRWNFSYSAVDTTTPCGIPGLQEGCGGGGTLDLVQLGPRVTGSYSAGGGCQDCGGAWDYGGSGSVSSSSLMTLEFSLQGCAFRADIPTGGVDEVTGTVHCGLGGEQVARGTWRMTRSP